MDFQRAKMCIRDRALRLAGLREQVQVAVAPHKAPLSLTGKGRAAG